MILREKKVYFNFLWVLLLRIAIMLLIFSICRLVFLLINKSYFTESETISLIKIFFFGLRFDLSSIIFINVVYIILFTLPIKLSINKWYQKISEILFYVLNSIGILLNCIDMAYFRFIFRRTTWDVVKGMFVGDDMENLFLSYIIDFWYIGLIWFGLIFLMVFLFKKTKKILLTFPQSPGYYAGRSVIFLLIIALSVILFRGGFQLRPISIVTAAGYTAPDNVPLLINTPFSIYTTVQTGNIDEKKYFESNEVTKVFNTVRGKKESTMPQYKNHNVIILIVESLSEEYIGKLNKFNQKGHFITYTPFLDSLIDYSLCYENTFANAKRSIEGIPAIVSGIPSLMDESFLTSTYSGNKVNSPANLLKKYGYKSFFFHGGKNGTMNFDSYASLAGFDEYHGRNEYNNDADYDGEWGIYDEEFLQYCAKKLTESKKPFFSVIFTLSSHHPYSIPKKYKNKFNKGTQEIHESIGYTDFSIRRFIKAMQKHSSFDSTFVIITADHTSLSDYEYYKNPVGVYSIPLIIFKQNSTFIGRSSIVSQQIDILPTIMDLLSFPEKFSAFGNSVFDSSANRYSVQYFNNTYQLINDEFILQFSNDKPVALYRFNDKLLEENLIKQLNPGDFNDEEQLLKAIIQTHHHKMKNNKLTIAE